ncbi:MAG: tetratricopeptide repeat protein [Candidatus Binataceae bacterium]
MKRRRNLARLQLAIEHARTDRARALAFYQLALFHDNNTREAEAIPNYEQALRLGLSGETRAQAFAWLASTLHKTGRPRRAIRSLALARAATRDAALKKFLGGLERRIRRA